MTHKIMETVATLYARNGSQIDIRKKHGYYTIWKNGKKIDGANARSYKYASFMAHNAIAMIHMGNRLITRD